MITQIGYEAEDDVDDALDRSEQIVYEVGRRQLRGEFNPITRLLKDAFEQIDMLYQQPRRSDRRHVGLPPTSTTTRPVSSPATS